MSEMPLIVDSPRRYDAARVEALIHELHAAEAEARALGLPIAGRRRLADAARWLPALRVAVDRGVRA